MKSNLRFCASLVWETASKNRSTSVPLAFLMKKLKSKVATGMFELIGCADSEMNAVFCEGVLVVGADAGGSGVSRAGSGTLSCWYIRKREKDMWLSPEDMEDTRTM